MRVQYFQINMEPLVFERITTENAEKVIVHLRHNFFADEPLNKSLGLCKPGHPHQELEEFSLNIVNQEHSFMAATKESGEVVGVFLNGVSEQKKGERKLFKDQKLQKIFDFLGNADKDVEFMSKFNLSSVLELKVVSVDHKFRGRGIAADLFKESENYARSKGFQLLRGDCTSLFSQQLFLKFGFVVLKEIVYEEYPTKEAPLFRVEPPHLSYKLLVKELK